MKIPFIKGELEVTQERIDFIKNTRGGSAGVFAGAIFWILAVVISLITSKEIAAAFYIFGGIFIIPIGSTIIQKLTGQKIEKSSYNMLIILSNMLFAFLYPLIMIIQSADLNYVPQAIALINGAHILIFMWVHYEFLHLILAGLSFIVSCFFIFIAPEMSYIGVGSISAIINIVCGYLIFKSTENPLSEYKYRVIERKVSM